MDQIANEIVVVRVSVTANVIGGQPASQLWAAAVPRDQALAAVLREVPDGSTAELADQRLTQEQVRALAMKPGSVRALP